MHEQQTKCIQVVRKEQAGTTACRLLSLPAELRCWIWRLSFTGDRSGGAMTDLFTAAGPNSALLATCQQIKAEAMEFYMAAAAGPDWWSTAKFCILPTARNPFYESTARNPFSETTVGLHFREDVEALDDKKLKLITRLRVSGPEYTVEFTNGVWTCDCWQSEDPQPPEHRNALRSSSCPRRAMYVKASATRSLWSDKRYQFWDAIHSVAGLGVLKRHFAMLRSDLSEQDVVEVKEMLEWGGLTKEELLAMLQWCWDQR